MSSLIGKRFGKLVIQRADGHGKFVCLCDCGEEVIVWGTVLNRGRKDCGCSLFSAKDITGRKFRRWTVLGPVNKNRSEKWRCRCECGNEKVVDRFSLMSGDSLSCGCLQKEVAIQTGKKTVLDLTGKKFGRLIVVGRDELESTRVGWICKCDCGKTKTILASSLTSGNTISCGCFRSERMVRIMTNPDLTDEERELSRNRRVDQRVIEWRKAVYERDNYLCMVCGKNSGKDLTAHHKESWNKHKELRFSVENGVTCCWTCHKQFHDIFGYGDNTTDEWDMFLKHRGVEGVVFQRPLPKRRIKIDLTGQKFSELTVLRFDESNRIPHWICKCDCGLEKSICEHGLKRGTVKSCGCRQKKRTTEMGKRNFRDLTGKVSGKFIVEGKGIRNNFWICRCNCGGIESFHRKTIMEQTVHRCKNCGVG